MDHQFKDFLHYTKNALPIHCRMKVWEIPAEQGGIPISLDGDFSG